MKRSILLEKLFEMERWQYHIDKAEAKGINKAVLTKLCDPQWRAEIYLQIKHNKLNFLPAHQAAIPKPHSSEMRIVYVGEAEERVLCPMITDVLFEVFHHRIHKTCWSYQKGLSSQKAVRELVRHIGQIDEEVIGFKSDIKSAFDNFSSDAVYRFLDELEEELGFDKGTEPVINLIRRMYSNNMLFTEDNELIDKWSGIRQGNALASFLMDAILYPLDDYMSKHYSYFIRYSDDMIVLTTEVDKALSDVDKFLNEYGLWLSPKKTETLYKSRYFKFLGYSIKGKNITLSKDRLDNFEKEVKVATICQQGVTYEKALHNFYKYFYIGDGKHSPAQQILGTVNSYSDLNRMNNYVQDCLRAVVTGKKKLYGLGYKKEGNGSDGVIPFTPGPNVKKNKEKVPYLNGYRSIMYMRNALISDKAAYDTLVRCLV